MVTLLWNFGTSNPENYSTNPHSQFSWESFATRTCRSSGLLHLQDWEQNIFAYSKLSQAVSCPKLSCCSSEIKVSVKPKLEDDFRTHKVVRFSRENVTTDFLSKTRIDEKEGIAVHLWLLVAHPGVTMFPIFTLDQRLKSAVLVRYNLSKFDVTPENQMGIASTWTAKRCCTVHLRDVNPYSSAF